MGNSGMESDVLVIDESTFSMHTTLPICARSSAIGHSNLYVDECPISQDSVYLIR